MQQLSGRSLLSFCRCWFCCSFLLSLLRAPIQLPLLLLLEQILLQGTCGSGVGSCAKQEQNSPSFFEIWSTTDVWLRQDVWSINNNFWYQFFFCWKIRQLGSLYPASFHVLSNHHPRNEYRYTFIRLLFPTFNSLIHSFD